MKEAMEGKNFEDDVGIESFVRNRLLTRPVSFNNNKMKNFRLDEEMSQEEETVQKNNILSIL